MDFSRLTDPDAYKQALAGLLRRGGEVTDFIATAPEKAGQAILEGHEKNKALQAQAFANPDRPFQVTNEQAMTELGDRMLAGPLSVAPVGMIKTPNGTPQTFYHGTKSDIEEFIPSRGGEYGSGIYFAETPEGAAYFAKNAKGVEGENIIPVNLDIKNPLNVTAYERDKVRSKSIKDLMKKGYDGIVATGLTGEKQFVAFKPEQVISTITKKPITRKEVLADELDKLSK
jgi:hypothetical protein